MIGYIHKAINSASRTNLSLYCIVIIMGFAQQLYMVSFMTEDTLIFSTE